GAIVARGAPDLENVAEAFRGQESGARVLALEDQVGGDGGAVPDESDVAARQAADLQDLAHACRGADRGILRSGGHLRGPDAAATLVDQHHVRERTPDVYANSFHGP